jgi:hypothetical protein
VLNVSYCFTVDFIGSFTFHHTISMQTCGGEKCYKNYASRLVADNKTTIRLWRCDVNVMVVYTSLEGRKVVSEENV